MPISENETHRRLRSIAVALGVPVETFFDTTWRLDHSETAECVELCCRIRTQEGRRQALSHLREIVERETSARE